MAGTYEVCREVAVDWNESTTWRNQPIGPTAGASTINEDGDVIRFLKVYASAEEAKAAAKELAEQLKAHKPAKFVGFFSNPKLNAKEGLEPARAEVERLIRDWAGDTPYKSDLA